MFIVMKGKSTEESLLSEDGRVQAISNNFWKCIPELIEGKYKVFQSESAALRSRVGTHCRSNRVEPRNLFVSGRKVLLLCLATKNSQKGEVMLNVKTDSL